MAERIVDLSGEDLVRVVTHPAQQAAIELITELLTELRAATSVEELNRFQHRLFSEVLAADTNRSAVRRTVNRLASHKSPDDRAPRIPDSADPNDPETWRIEDLVWRRIGSQLRAVGDALAWRASRYNRVFFVVASANQPAGPMAMKDGLVHELAALDRIRDDHGNFVLLNDLTTCVRLADLTVFLPDGGICLTEVKASEASRNTKQFARIEQAVRAATEGAEMPGQPGTRLVGATKPFRTNIEQLGDAARLASTRGTVAMRVPGGRVLVMTDITAVAKDPQTNWFEVYQRERGAGLKRAGITDEVPHISARSREVATGLAPRNVPFGCYPLSEHQCALLIADYLTFEMIFVPRDLVGTFEKHGMHVTLYPFGPGGSITSSTPIFQLARGVRGLTVRAGALNEYLLELVHADCFVSGMADLLDDPNPPEHPVFVYGNEASYWR